MALFKNLTAGDVLPLASPPATVRSYDILTYSNGKVAPFRAAFALPCAGISLFLRPH